ncbi:glutaredoxin-related protein 5, mitochondrial-like [Oppia nitens]|uniref:glutaredoxin-related protein 5, mitochondrial-like n=1 Tax=Oppia nitens TaxID=1686743 RepID=UPI0023DBC660|nr:glutaredoxin-related protein 5, mitochondrial-like [Oppia nitens]
MALTGGLSAAYRTLLRSPIMAKNGVGARLCLMRHFTDQSADDVKTKIDKLVANNKVVVFMKGDPQQPRCGFSNAVIQVLRMHGVEYDAHDVLASDDLRLGIKEYTSWPTIPQVFMNGEFIGGCDILLEKHQNGELVDDLNKIGIKSALLDSQLTKDSGDK